MQSSQISLFSSSFAELPPGPCSELAMRTYFPSKTQGHQSPSNFTYQPFLPPLSESPLSGHVVCPHHPGVREIGEMVGLNSEELERALCSRTMETAKEKVVTALNVIQVRDPMKGPILSLFYGYHTNSLVPPAGSVCSRCSG